ncbi:MAG TPA: mechanosensitive ion channel domain-containing protein [Kofleriaceae bacterium]|nr:mechanosensitive ion channel domain-containing protein [Kofleriaceae bacterium]
MLETILDYLQTPLIVLSGTPVTTLTMVTAVAIIAAARLIGAIVGRSVDRVFVMRGLDQGLRFAIGKILRYSITAIGVIVALSTVGINTGAVMAGGAVLLVGIGFGLQKLAENFISGLLLLIERPVRKGDYIDVAGVLGTVEDIGLRATHVVSRDGLTVIVPNASLISNTVINHSQPSHTRRIWVRVGVAYGTDLDHATKILLEVAAGEPKVQTEPTPDVRHDGFGDSSITLALVVWIREAKEEALVASKLRFAISRAFRAHGIVIPVPQREIHVHPAPPAA